MVGLKLDVLNFAVVRNSSRCQVPINNLSGSHPVASEQITKLTFTHFAFVVGLDFALPRIFTGLAGSLNFAYMAASASFREPPLAAGIGLP